MLGPFCLLCAVCCSVLQSVGSVLCLVFCVMCSECLYVRARVCVCSSRVQACACVFVCVGSFVSFVCLVRGVLSVLGPSCALGVMSRAVIYGRPFGCVNIHTAFLFKSQLQMQACARNRHHLYQKPPAGMFQTCRLGSILSTSARLQCAMGMNHGLQTNVF